MQFRYGRSQITRKGNEMAEVHTRVRQFIQEHVYDEEKIQDLTDDTSLRHEDIVDSLLAEMLIEFLEEQYGIVVSDREATEANLGTIRAIAEFVERKTEPAAIRKKVTL